MKRILRYIIAVIFMISGFVKAVDVKGFAIKLDEYFAPDVFNMPFFQKYSLEMAIFVVALELLLGIMLLLKIQLKKTLIALILLCVFFAFLTFYSAFYNKVTDCGCFGDAIKFTPWQSFWKDIALLVGLLILWFLNKKNFSEINKIGTFKKLVFAVLVLFSGWTIARGILHEPIIDFRAYKIGTDLNQEKQKIAENPDVYKTFYTLKNTKTGEEKSVNQDDYVNIKEYWQEGTPWQIQSGKEKSELVKKGYNSEISKFKIEDATGNDVTTKILHLQKVFLVFSYNPDDMKKADENIMHQLQKLAGNGAQIYGISTKMNVFPSVENLMMDGTAIKTIARSNPFVLVLENGVIKEKKSLKDFLEK